MSNEELIGWLIGIITTLGSVVATLALHYHSERKRERTEYQSRIAKLETEKLAAEKQVEKLESDIRALIRSEPQISGRYRYKRHLGD